MKSATRKVKEELAQKRSGKKCCTMAELSALLHIDGTYKINSIGHAIVVESANAHTARRTYALLHSLFDIKTTLIKVEASTPRRQNIYRIEISEQPSFFQFLNEVGILDEKLNLNRRIPERLVKNNCCLHAALRGAFLGGGYVSEPHGIPDFEISFSTAECAQFFRELFNRCGLEPGIRRRKGSYVLYLKNRESITRFLALVGAHSSCLEWESQSIINATKNRVNRLVNCDAANAKRLASASKAQRDAILRLKEMGILESLDAKLREVAILRLKHPEASLTELASILNPPVSKSTLQGRMRRLTNLVK